MNKAWLLAPHEDWIVDRFVREFNKDNKDIVVPTAGEADVIWMMADWCYLSSRHRGPDGIVRTLPELISFMGKKSITTIHHIVPEKFRQGELADFHYRDRYTSVYHVPNKYTEEAIRPLTQKRIEVIEYWANDQIFSPTTLETLDKVPAILPTKQFIP